MRGAFSHEDRYVLGRIAEHLGLNTDATAYYKRVEKPEKPNTTATYHLARRRLQKLGKAGK